MSESLAGRIGILELDPLTVAEVTPGTPKKRWTDVWLRGGFPDALRGNFREWWEAYLRAYLERDLPWLGVKADPVFLRRLLTMLAHGQGGMLMHPSPGAGTVNPCFPSLRCFMSFPFRCAKSVSICRLV